MAVEIVNGQPSAVFETDNGRIVVPLEEPSVLSKSRLPPRRGGMHPTFPSRDGIGELHITEESPAVAPAAGDVKK